ncbi:MAG: acetyl-CoA carboxylase biotin carboxyl carrier protein [Kineosporiaceae bacterium]
MNATPDHLAVSAPPAGLELSVRTVPGRGVEITLRVDPELVVDGPTVAASPATAVAGDGGAPAPAPVPVTLNGSPPPAAPEERGGPPSSAAAAGDAIAVRAPLVGVVYRRPAPGDPPFVEVGSTVAEGDSLLIVEAMKMMNHIPAPAAGTVTAIDVEEKAIVDFDQVLVRLAPAGGP